jgi:hypothetical protein
MTYTDHLLKNRRLTILRLLDGAPAYSLNDSVVQAALEEFAHSVSRDIVRADLVWLKEQGLADIEVVTMHCWVAKATQQGLDVSHGRAENPGVARPSPRR